MNIKTFGQVDQRSFDQLKRCMEAGDAEYGVLCADHHPGYSQPIGAAIAYEGYVSPSGAGYDIGCGNKAARTDLTRADLDALGGVERLMHEITRRISFGMGVPAQERADHPVLDKIRKAGFASQRRLHQLAESQLGTVGSGNHYVNLMEDEVGRVWVGVHFGSRGFGHKTASGFLALAQGLPFGERASEGEMDSPPVLFEVGSELGEAYVAAMELAGEYASAGRDVVVGKVLEILGAEAKYEVHNHHNFCIAGTELIPTRDGVRTMDALRSGDTVFAFDEHQGLVETRVLRAWRSGRKPIYSIETANRRIRVSGEHLVLTVQTTLAAHPERPWHARFVGRLVWKRADDLQVGEALVCADTFPRNAEPVGAATARFVGAFLGDGWVRHTGTRLSGYSVGLAIGAPGEPHTGRYLRLCSALFPDARWRANRPGAFGLSCSSKAMWERVSTLGVGLRSSRRRVPAYAYRLPIGEQLELLAGYVDTDGSVARATTSNHGRATLVSTSAELAEGMRELAIGVGMHATIVRGTPMRTNLATGVAYRFVLDSADAAALDLWHERKRANLRTARFRRRGLAVEAIGYLSLPPRTFAQRIRSISVGAPEDVYDATVEHDSHAFVCSGIVVHNCWREEHFGRTYWVIRKGCTPARPGQEGFVGGSMGDESVILEGLESDENRDAMFSTVHGAGRVMSRSQAAGRVRRMAVYACSTRDCDFTVPAKGYAGETCPRHPDSRMRKLRTEVQLKPGVVDWPAVQARLREQGIVLLGGGADEAPEVYKRLPDVLAAHGDTIRVKHTLRPLGVAMAGRDVHDPYKD